MLSKLNKRIRKYQTSVTEHFVECNDIPSIHYDFRKSKLTVDLIHVRAYKKVNREEKSYHLIEFLEVSVFLTHEGESYLEELEYKASQYLNDFATLIEGEKHKIHLSSQRSSGAQSMPYHRDRTSLCNVFIEIEGSQIFIKAKKIRINNEEFMLE